MFRRKVVKGENWQRFKEEYFEMGKYLVDNLSQLKNWKIFQ